MLQRAFSCPKKTSPASPRCAPCEVTHASMPKRKTYTRDDGCLMIEISPNLYVEESIAERLGLLR
jgi:hypothetical protein